MLTLITLDRIKTGPEGSGAKVEFDVGAVRRRTVVTSRSSLIFSGSLSTKMLPNLSAPTIVS